MTYEPTSRYPSWATASDAPEGGTIMIDGLDVVDEQVVVLSPLEPRGTQDRHRRTRPSRWATPRAERGGGYGVG